MKNLGYMNGWFDGTPEELKKCRELGHELEKETIGRCLNEYTCDICNIKYKIDSSD